MSRERNSIVIFNNPFSFFALFWLLYRLQALWYHAGGLISQLLLAGLLLVSLYHTWILLFKSKKTFYFKGLFLMLLVFTIYGILLFFTDGSYTKGLRLRPPTYYYLKAYYCSLLPIVSCYYYTTKGYLNARVLQKWVIVFLLAGLVEYYHWQQMIAIEMRELGLDETNVNNIGYVMVALIPSLLIFKKTWWKFTALGICVLFAFLSMKRGAILCAMILTVLFIFINMKSMQRGKKAYTILFIAIVSVLLIGILQDTLFQNDFFQRRVERTLEGDVSGRDDLYRTYIYYFEYEMTPIEQLTGLGADGTLKISSNYAHNDWLELLIDQGLLGIVCYLFYWLFFVKTLTSKKISTESKGALILLFSFTFIKSLYSMSISNMNIYIACVFGFSLANGFSSNYRDSAYK